MTLAQLISQFHFLRPLWLLALIPSLAITWWYLRQLHKQRPKQEDKLAQQQKKWASHVDSHLLPYLMIGQQGMLMNSQRQQADSTQTPNLLKKRKPALSTNRLLSMGLFAGVIAGILAIAGPTWEQKPVPAIAGNTPTVIVLSLAQSMSGDDIKPSRMQRAVHKVRDILAQTQGEQRALVIYADTAFVATPLTNDSQVIQKMLPELSTGLMPLAGNRLDIAIGDAIGVLQRGGAWQGNIIVITDSIGNDKDKTLHMGKRAHQAGYRVSVLGVGTQDAVNNANTLMPLEAQALQDLAGAGGGAYRQITASNQDVQALINNTANANGLFHQDGRITDSDTHDWVDMGYWLLLIPLILMPFAFRRGTFGANGANRINRINGAKRDNNKMLSVLPLLFCGLLGVSVLTPHQVYALDATDVTDAKSVTVVTPPSIFSKIWQALWLTTRQQAQRAFDNGWFEQALHLFSMAGEDDNTVRWRASSAYRVGDYQQSAHLFAQQHQDYNLGNALAKSGDLQGALEAYERHLTFYSDDEDAIYNRELIKKLLDEQQHKQAQDQENQQGQQGQENQQNGQGNQDQKDNGDKDNRQNAQAQQDQQGNANQNSGNQNNQNPDNAPNNEQQTQDTQQDEQGLQQNNNNNDTNEAQGQSAQDAKRQASDGQLTHGDGLDKHGLDKHRRAFVPQPLDQAHEQALRRVPDDASGLLRNRIMQHYLQQQYLEQQAYEQQTYEQQYLERQGKQ